jgi:streptomycin 3"-adenylyltransferase
VTTAGEQAPALAQDVVRLVRDVLGEDVLGAYLHGSAVLDGLRPGSDVDVLAVLRRSATTAERRALVDGLLDISGSRARRGPARPVELTLVVQSDVRPWRYPPRSDFLYGEWLRDDYERGVLPAPERSPDLAVLVRIVLLGDAPLWGPPPAELLDPVPVMDLDRAVVAGVPELLTELESDTRNVVLTLARIWTTLATGVVKSKDAAADWVLESLPAELRPVLVRARNGYLESRWESWDDLLPQVRAHVDHVVRQIERLAPHP